MQGTWRSGTIRWWRSLRGSPLVGRGGEVATLLAAAEEAGAPQPRCVVVTGEAGIGKSRLVVEALARLADALVLTGHGPDMATGEIPFGVLADTLRDLRRQHGDGALMPEQRARLAPLPPGEAGSTPAEPARILGGALDLFTRLSHDQLMVWVVEGLHWADDATRDLLNLSARSVHGRLLLLITLRTDDHARPAAAEAALAEQIGLLTRLPHAVRVDLRRLTESQVQALVSSLAADLPPEQVRTITRLSDGTPFVVDELTIAGDRPTETTVVSPMNGRLAQLDPEARQLVEAAAIGDGHLRISLLEQVAALCVSDPGAALAGGVDAGVLICDYTRDQVHFRHALLRQAVEASIYPQARRGWHCRWARLLEQNPRMLAADLTTLAIAEHWHQGGERPRSVSAAYAAIPAARRTSDDNNRRIALWLRILDGWNTRDKESPLGRLPLRRVIGGAFKGPRIAVDDGLNAKSFDAADRLPLQAPERALLEVCQGRPLQAENEDPDDVGVVRAAAVATG